MSITNTWWAVKYRPTKRDDFVGDSEFLDKIDHWIETNDVPNILLTSEKSGIGKTTAAWMIANSIDAEILYINASDDNNIETVRDRIKSFVSTTGFKTWKIVICDEFSYFSINAQSALNSIIETYSRSARFIITANYIEKILPSIRSRCTQFKLDAPPKVGIVKRMEAILQAENVEYDVRDIAKIVKELYPDQRSIINYLQDNSHSGTFKLSSQDIIINDYCEKVLANLTYNQATKISFGNIRQIIADSKIRQFNDLYKFLFERLDDYAPDGKKGLVILAIADYQYKDNFVVDKEINAMALIVNILTIIK